MNRGVLYIVWPGETNVDRLLDRSIESLQRIHPELPYHVERLPEGSTLLDKSRMRDISPFATTLFLDADTVVMDRLDFGFERAEQFGLACSICECPYARRFTALADRGDLVEYNTGVLFFAHWHKELFDLWQLFAKRMDSRLPFLHRGQLIIMPINDQASFAYAMYQAHCSPFVLPMNWNFRPIWHRSYFGPVKIWHDYSDPPEQFLDFNQSQLAEDAVIDFFTCESR